MKCSAVWGVIITTLYFSLSNNYCALAQDVGHADNLYHLESYPSYSTVLVLPATHESEGSKNETLVVQAPRFHRVMAVIQYINLSPRNDFACGSYLQFQDGVDKRSVNICGNFDPEEKGFEPPSLVGPRSYVSSRDTLKVFLTHTGNQGKTEKSYVRIAFTAYREDCYFTNQRNWTATSGTGLPRYRPCEYAVSSDGIGRQCIVSTLFCDHVVNCAPTDVRGTDFAQDESQLNCPHIYSLPSVINVNSNKTSNSTSDSTDSENEDKDNPNLKDGTIFKQFFDEREERLANIFKSAIIGFVGICTICILIAFIISMFCLKQSYDLQES